MVITDLGFWLSLFRTDLAIWGDAPSFKHTGCNGVPHRRSHKPLIVNSGGGLSVEIFHLGIKLHAALEIDIGHFISKLVLGIVAVPCALLGIACNAVADFLVRNATVIEQTDVML